MAHVTPIPETVEKGIEVEALMRNVIDQFDHGRPGAEHPRRADQLGAQCGRSAAAGVCHRHVHPAEPGEPSEHPGAEQRSKSSAC